MTSSDDKRSPCAESATAFDWGIAFGSSSYGDPIHHIAFGGRMLCSGGKAHVTHYGTPSAPRPCKRCLYAWRAQTKETA